MKLTRRQMLRAAGVSLALPVLEYHRPHGYAASAARPIRRMVCINTPLGVHPANFFPKTAGRDYELSPYLEIFKEFRNDFTVISGLTHTVVGPSHDSNNRDMPARPHPDPRMGFRNTISHSTIAADTLRH